MFFYSSVTVLTSNVKLYIKLNAMPYFKNETKQYTHTHRERDLSIAFPLIRDGLDFFSQTYPNHFHKAPNYELTFSQKHSYPRLHFSNLRPSLSKQ